MQDRDFVLILKTWNKLQDVLRVTTRLSESGDLHMTAEKEMRALVKYRRGALRLVDLHEWLKQSLQECEDPIKEEILQQTEGWVSQIKELMRKKLYLHLSLVLVPKGGYLDGSNELEILVNKLRDYINDSQRGKPIYGVLHFWSETGTEGGHWALQDKRFITPREANVGYDSWDYWGLHVLENGDELTIYDDEDGGEVLWSGVIDLEKYDVFTETTSHGFWKHSDQKGIPKEAWEKCFFKENYSGKLIKKNDFLPPPPAPPEDTGIWITTIKST
jgi:hypothetical protein